MAKKRTTAEEPPLKPREGKVLRFIVSRSSGTYQAPVQPSMTVVSIEWSDLPHTLMQAVTVFKKLKKLELIKQDGEGYQATAKGAALIRKANKADWWNTNSTTKRANSRRY